MNLRPDDYWETIMEINQRLTVLEARSGMVRIPVAAWALLLTMLGVVIGAAVRQERLANEVVTLQRDVASYATVLSAHVQIEGHPVGLDRLRRVERELDKIRGN